MVDMHTHGGRQPVRVDDDYQWNLIQFRVEDDVIQYQYDNRQFAEYRCTVANRHDLIGIFHSVTDLLVLHTVTFQKNTKLFLILSLIVVGDGRPNQFTQW